MTAVNQNLTLLAGKTFYVCPTVGTHQVIVGHQKRETKRVQLKCSQFLGKMIFRLQIFWKMDDKYNYYQTEFRQIRK